MATPLQIKFDVPEEFRTFTIFLRLPPEIRQRIWEAYLSTPGIHFLKLQTSDADWSWTERRVPSSMAHEETEGTEESDEGEAMLKVLRADKTPREAHRVHLIPVGPCPRADVSHYKALRRQLATLSSTCLESRSVAKRLASRPETLRLGNGSIISLGRSPDLIYLDYFPPSLYQSNGNLETIPDCPELCHVKRVAVRFSHIWQPTKKLCRCDVCKKSAGTTHKGIYPAHLYQLLARHFPNLEEFFFIDYFVVHKSKSQHCVDGTQAKGPSMYTQRFQAGNRSYHEANEQEWIMNTDVNQIMSWLRSSYVSYAKESSLCRHKSPEKVRFAVLACEWKISPPMERAAMPLRSDAKTKQAVLNFSTSTVRFHSISTRHNFWLREAEAANTRPHAESLECLTKVDYARRNFTFPSPIRPLHRQTEVHRA